jgi:hypothetical protein
MRASGSASGSLVVNHELVGSLPDAALDGSQGRQRAIATGLTIPEATAAN